MRSAHRRKRASAREKRTFARSGPSELRRRAPGPRVSSYTDAIQEFGQNAQLIGSSRRSFCSAWLRRLMRWTPGDRSNIEDARGRSGGGIASIGIGGFLILLVLSWATGTNLFSLLGTDSAGPSSVGTSGEVRTTPEEERLVDLVDAVTRDAQKTWEELLGGR